MACKSTSKYIDRAALTTIKLCATKILAVLGYIVSLRFIVYVESNTTLVSLKLSKIMRPPARAPRHLPIALVLTLFIKNIKLEFQ